MVICVGKGNTRRPAKKLRFKDMFKGTHEKVHSAKWLYAVKKSIAPIKGKRRKNYQTVNGRRLLNSLHKRHMCTLALFVTANVPIQ